MSQFSNFQSSEYQLTTNNNDYQINTNNYQIDINSYQLNDNNYLNNIDNNYENNNITNNIENNHIYENYNNKTNNNNNNFYENYNNSNNNIENNHTYDNYNNTINNIENNPINENYNNKTNNIENNNFFEYNNNINNDSYEIDTNNNFISDNNYQINNNNYDEIINNININNNNDYANNNNIININNNNDELTFDNKDFPITTHEIQDTSNIQMNLNNLNQNTDIDINQIFDQSKSRTNEIHTINNNISNPQTLNNSHNKINKSSIKIKTHSVKDNNNDNIQFISKAQSEQKEEEKEKEVSPYLNMIDIYTPELYSEVLKNILSSKSIESKEEDVIIKIIEKTNNNQRQHLRQLYHINYYGNLILTLKKELSGNFRESVLGSFLLPSEYDTYCLNSSFKNSTQKKESILSEIIGSRTNTELQMIKKLYASNYRKLLKKEIITETHGEFQKFLLSLLQCQRSTSSNPNTNSCANDASDLYQAGEKNSQNDEDTLIRIFTTSSPLEIAITNHFYKQQTGKGLLGAIETEFECCKETKDLLEIIVRALVDKNAFYAKKIKDSINEGNDAKLIRIICSRHGVDLTDIKNAYKKDYQKNLEDDIKEKMEHNWGKVIYYLVINAN